MLVCLYLWIGKLYFDINLMMFTLFKQLQEFKIRKISCRGFSQMLPIIKNIRDVLASHNTTGWPEICLA